ncbi:MAG: ATP-binding protein [Calditrichia bacterium]|nr:ATP-binding protein [Calditrichia bacterium]
MTDIEKKTFKLTISSDSANLNKVDNLCTKAIKSCGMNESNGDDFAIAVTELVNNAIHHGNKNNKDKQIFINILIRESKLEAHIKDEGNGFNPDLIGNPLDPDNLMKESGRGIFLIKQLTDSLDFNFTDNGTEIIISKNI